MSRGERGSTGSVSLEQLLALNEEIAALVRAGVPLEQGLSEIGRELPGRAGKLAEFLGARMRAGQSLPAILASDPESFPPVWRAVVEAGLRAGCLPVALEALTTTVRRVAELRKVIGLALVYPLLVLTLAFGLFVVVVTRLAPITARAYQALTGDSEALLTSLSRLGQTAPWWGTGLPLLSALGLAAWWYRSRRAMWQPGRTTKARWDRGWLTRWGILGRALGDGRLAAFAEILSLLVEQQVALPAALCLAGDASGDRGLAVASRKLADRLQRGEVPQRREDLPQEFPPVLGWLLMTGHDRAKLSEALSRTAAVYRERAARAAQWTAVYLPIALTVVVGGTATFVQALITLGPIWRLWYALGRPV